MRAPISGIVTGFRMRKGVKEGSDFGVIDILQCGDSKVDSALILAYVEDFELCTYLLNNYANGQLRWIDTYCMQMPQGREMVWVLQKIFNFPDETIQIETA